MESENNNTEIVEKPTSKFPLIKKASELNWILGVFIVALGVAIANKANLGVSMVAAPPFIIYDAVKDS